MPKFMDSCQKYFGTKDFYQIFHLKKACHLSEIKKAYYKLALQHHPDRSEKHEEKDQQNEKFKVIGKVYSILADPDQRAAFDATGTIDEDSDDVLQSNYEVWLDLFTKTFKRVTVEDIKEFERTYKGSADERDDLKAIYVQCEGNMEAMWEHIMISNVIDDEERIRKIIEELVAEKEVPEYEAFTKETEASKKKRRKKAEKEAKEATTLSEDLIKTIALRQGDRQQQFDQLINNLQERYAAEKPKKTPTTPKQHVASANRRKATPKRLKKT